MFQADGPKDDDLAAFGLPPELTKSFIEDSTCWVWPQNWNTVMLFLAMQTQWRVGMSGATGLDYAALPVIAKGEGIRLKPSRIAGLRVMESEALKQMAAARPAAS